MIASVIFLLLQGDSETLSRTAARLSDDPAEQGRWQATLSELVDAIMGMARALRLEVIAELIGTMYWHMPPGGSFFTREWPISSLRLSPSSKRSLVARARRVSNGRAAAWTCP